MWLKVTKKANYQKNDNEKNQSQFELIKKLELSANTHTKLINYCKKKRYYFYQVPLI